MPKFYRGNGLGFAYKARAVGWRRVFPLSLLPYLTGDKIQLHLSIKPLSEGQEWQQGILQIEPPDLFRDNPELSAIVSSTIFELGEWDPQSPTPPKYQFPMNKWWARTLSLKGGVRFGQPGVFGCTLVCQNIDNNKVIQTAPIRIADIEVMVRSNFFMWLFAIAVSIMAIIFSAVY